ncbi:MAG: proline dehydrogenase family protein [Candidatus Omnitrophica bacterium]|nr:proline dehydrogenase family protein [Candidatus Omnitrophota bacterium]
MKRKPHSADIEKRTKEIGQELIEAARKHQRHAGVLARVTDQVLAWCFSNPEIKPSVLRFVDVLPSLNSSKEVLEHLKEYFPSREKHLPSALKAGLAVSRPSLLTGAAASALTRKGVEQMAARFIAEESEDEVLPSLRSLEKEGCGFSLDLLGEAVLSTEESDAYVERYMHLAENLPHVLPKYSEAARFRLPAPRLHFSLKPSALSPWFNPLQQSLGLEDAFRRIAPFAEAARNVGAFVNLDMEQYRARDLTLELAKKLMGSGLLGGYPHLGVVIQAYLKDARPSLEGLLDWAAPRGQELTVRLVRGAYWDAETAESLRRGWESPVLRTKAETDLQFETLLELLLLKHPTVRTALASHNVRSVARALAIADLAEVPRERLEFQLLYGMAEPLREALVERGCAVRVYVPCGPLIPGMAYLVRRLLENSSNEALLRQDYDSESILKELVAPEPDAGLFPVSFGQVRKGDFANEPQADFSRPEMRRHMREALKKVRKEMGGLYPVNVGGEWIFSEQADPSVNPADPPEIIGRVSRADASAVEGAVEAAIGAGAEWRSWPVERRANLLRAVAGLLRRRRWELAALEVLEVGKTWAEADADVTEALDFLEYYAQEAAQLFEGKALYSPPGELNTCRYQPLGVCAVIAPWNFPLAILTGMSSAALVTGNTVILKPAEQSPVIAHVLFSLFKEAGLPKGVLNLLPGPGAVVGEALVAHPEINAVLFTGSAGVGTGILEKTGRAAARGGPLKRVIAEMGGKNALIVDSDADWDEALPAILRSAFGFQGQKCSALSRLIVLDTIYDEFLGRLCEAVSSLVIGPPEEPQTDLGPVIDQEAFQKIQRYIAMASTAGKIVYQMEDSELPERGYFIGPVIVSEVDPLSPLAREEIFGPVLCLLRARDFEEAIELANDCEFALSAGVFSRSPRNIEQATRRLEAGNIYINQKITGALVARQPFGGYKRSGLGSKAGGPDYLQQLVLPKTVTENTTRHGVPL